VGEEEEEEEGLAAGAPASIRGCEDESAL